MLTVMDFGNGTSGVPKAPLLIHTFVGNDNGVPVAVTTRLVIPAAVLPVPVLMAEPGHVALAFAVKVKLIRALFRLAKTPLAATMFDGES